MQSEQRGITLSEAVIVLAVIGTVIVVYVPRMSALLPNYHLTRAVRTLLVSVHRAKLQSIQRCAVHYLDFELDEDGDAGSGFCVLWEDRNDNHHRDLLETNQAVFYLNGEPHIALRTYPLHLGGPKRGPNYTQVHAGGGDGITFNQNRIKFNPNGTCSAGTIYLHNRTGRSFAIRVRSNGLVQLWQHDAPHSGWKR
jgi:hypothetical protein